MELKHPLNSVGAESLSLSLSRSINIRRNFNVNHYGSVNKEACTLKAISNLPGFA